MDNRFRTIFQDNNGGNNVRSLPKIGKASIVNPLRLESGSQGNIFQPVNSSDVLKFFDGGDNAATSKQAMLEFHSIICTCNLDQNNGPGATERLRSERVAASFPSGRGLQTDPKKNSKAAYSYELHQQVSCYSHVLFQ